MSIGKEQVFIYYSFSSCRGDLGFFSTVNQDGFKPNLETHLIPLLATKIEDNSLELKDQSNDSFLKDALHPLLKQVLFIPLATISIVLFVESKGEGIVSKIMAHILPPHIELEQIRSLSSFFMRD